MKVRPFVKSDDWIKEQIPPPEQNKGLIERIADCVYKNSFHAPDGSNEPRLDSNPPAIYLLQEAAAILRAEREPATEAVLRELVIEAREEFRHHSPEMDSWLVRADAALKGKGASQGDGSDYSRASSSSDDLA